LNLSDAVPPEIVGPLAHAGDRLGIFRGRLMWYDTVGSTNDLAARLGDEGADEGAIVVADEQTSGRGRLGRTWASPPGAGLYVSAVLRPGAHAMPLVTIAAGVALSEGVEAATGLSTQVKWPNDLLVSGRKLAGILAERRTPDRGSPYVVLGFGINVLPAAYPPDVAARATSLESELGRAVDRGLVLAECLSSLAARYRELDAGLGAQVLDAWRTRAAGTLGREVEWDRDGHVRRGVAEDIDGAGALLVRTGAGLERIIAGEVRWI
jgi:BirA family biotin operon repressor/biotin-[acetyl-CoA-carboxylase] ligase